MKILVPVDFVHPVQPSLEFLLGCRDISNDDIKFLYVRELLPAYENMMQSVGSFAEDWDRQLDAKAHAVFQEATAYIQPHCKSVQTEITSGSAPMLISSIAKEENYQLTVLTPGNHSGVERIFAGSVTNRVVAHGPGTLLLVRPKPNNGDILENVVVGFDGSANAKEAIATAINSFNFSAAKVTVVYSVDIVDPVKFLAPVAFISAIEQNMLMQGQAFLAMAEKQLKDGGVKNVECCLIEGDPASELIKIAAEKSADLMLIGAQGHSAIERFLVGSVSERLAIHAHCSVAIVKPNASETQK